MPNHAPLLLVLPIFGLPTEHSFINFAASNSVSMKHFGYLANLDHSAAAVPHLAKFGSQVVRY